MKKVSVIICVYNDEKNIGNAIESVQNQNYKNLEIIVVDDASTDGTYQIVNQYAKNDSRIQIVRTETNSRRGKKLFEPRNNGIMEATGDYICYLDADNVWLPSYIDELVKVLDLNPKAQLVACDSLNFYPPGRIDEFLAIDKRQLSFYGKDCACFTYDEIKAGDFGNKLYIDTNEMMHRNGIWDKIGGMWRIEHQEKTRIAENQLPEFSYRRHNDIELAERIYCSFGAESCIHLKRVLVRYHYNGQTTSELYSDDRIYHIQDSISQFNEKEYQPFSFRQCENLNVNHFYDGYLKKKSCTIKYHMGVGEIDFIPYRTDYSSIIQEFYNKENIIEKYICYDGMKGEEEGLEKIANFENALHDGMDLAPQNIVLTDGGHEALARCISFATSEFGNSMDSKQYIVAAMPSYAYLPLVLGMQRGIILFEACSGKEYIEGLKERMNHDIGAIIVNIPNNPTGYMLSKEQIGEINCLAEQYQTLIIVDGVYHTYASKKACSYFSLFSKNRTLFCQSFSKSFGLPGLRLGYIYTRNEKFAAMLRAQKSSYSLLPSSTKLKLIEFILEKYGDYPEAIAKQVKIRKNNFMKAYEKAEISFPVISDENDFYLLIDVEKIKGVKDTEIAEILRSNYGVDCVEGRRLYGDDYFILNRLCRKDSIYNQVQDYVTKHRSLIRFSFGKEDNVEKVVEAIKKLELMYS